MHVNTRSLFPGRFARILACVWPTTVFVAELAFAQKPPLRIEIGPSVRVSDAGAPHVEPYIAAHPEDPRNLIVTVTHLSGEQEGVVETFSTSDGGKTWSGASLPQLREALAHKEMAAPVVDSWATYAPDGTAYCSMVATMKRGHAWGRVPVLVYRSRDRGTSWEGPTVIGPFFDRPAMVAAGTGKEKRLFIAAMGITAPSEPSGVAVLRSDDDGRTFSRIVLTPDNLGHNGLNPVVTPEGLLIVPYVDFPSTSSAQFERRRKVMSVSRIYVVASRDQGQTFGLPRIVADVPRFATGFPELAVDLSHGKYRGRLYLSWNGAREGLQDVTVAHSQDNGETWLASSVKASGAGAAHFSSLAVSNDGTVGLAWIQHELEASKTNCWRAYFAASVDGGESFSAPTAVSGVVSCPDPIANKNALPRFERGGDYMGLAAAVDGDFHVVWPDCRDGAYQTYAARIAVRVD